jgi:hypothetical protein
MTEPLDHTVPNERALGKAMQHQHTRCIFASRPEDPCTTRQRDAMRQHLVE